MLKLVLLLCLQVIDNDWLSTHTPPYQLNQSYQLATDISTPGTTFNVVANNIILDLNGHTITYDNASPSIVNNGGFESGDFTGWDVSNMSHASIVSPVILGFWGAHQARFSVSASATPVKESMVSDPIAIVMPGILHEGDITIKGNVYGAIVTLSVLDVVTGTVLGTNTINTNIIPGGPMIYVRFTPSVNPVRLKLDITPPINQATQIDIDSANVARSGIHGIDFGYNRQNFKVINGGIAQGKGRSVRSNAVNAITGVSGLTLDALGLAVWGRDSCCVYSTYTTDPTVKNCNLTAGLDQISNRMAALGILSLSTCRGTVIVTNNTLTGKHQNGIAVMGNTDYMTLLKSVSILDNNISQDSSWSDGYGIGVSRIHNFEIARNQMMPISGRGMIVQCDTNMNVTDGTIHDNKAIVRERGNLEYGRTLNACALRIRNYNGTFANVDMFNNIWIAYTGEDSNSDQWCCGAKFSFNNLKGQLNNANVTIRDSLFKGIMVNKNLGLPTSRVYGITFAIVDPHAGISFSGITCESNHISLNFGDTDGINESDITMTNTILKKSIEGDQTLSFRTISAGGWGSTVSNIRLIGTKYENGASETPFFEGTGAKDISFGHTLFVRVIDSLGASVAEAKVTVLDGTGAVIASGVTDMSGIFGPIPQGGTIYTVAVGGGKPVVISSTIAVNVKAEVFKSGTMPIAPEDQLITIPIN